MLRRSRVQAMVLGLCALATVLFTISRIFGGSDGTPSGTPPVVIVTVMDVDNYSADYLESIKENRDEYAKKHGEKDPYPD
jgi:mannan polymerase II complex MNN11 subunit